MFELGENYLKLFASWTLGLVVGTCQSEHCNCFLLDYAQAHRDELCGVVSPLIQINLHQITQASFRYM